MCQQLLSAKINNPLISLRKYLADRLRTTSETFVNYTLAARLSRLYIFSSLLAPSYSQLNASHFLANHVSIRNRDIPSRIVMRGGGEALLCCQPVSKATGSELSRPVTFGTWRACWRGSSVRIGSPLNRWTVYVGGF